MAENSIEATVAALIAYIAFATAMFEGLWRDAEKERAYEAFRDDMKGKIRENEDFKADIVSRQDGIDCELKDIRGDLKDIKDMLRAGGLAAGASDASRAPLRGKHAART